MRHTPPPSLSRRKVFAGARYRGRPGRRRPRCCRRASPRTSTSPATVTADHAARGLPAYRARASATTRPPRSETVLYTDARPFRALRAVCSGLRQPRYTDAAHSQIHSSRRSVVGHGLQPGARLRPRHSHHGPARLPAPLRPGRGRRPGRFAAHAGEEGAGGRRAKPASGESKIEVKRTVCGHCSVGCAVDAVVENGVWVRQEPVFDSPINLGAHCAKGAALREHGHGEFRLKYPMKLVNGKYQRIELGPGARRDQRQDARVAQAERAGFDLRRRLVQAQQRAGLPAAQVGVALGHQQHRPPGAHLPLAPRWPAWPTPGGTVR